MPVAELDVRDDQQVVAVVQMVRVIETGLRQNRAQMTPWARHPPKWTWPGRDVTEPTRFAGSYSTKAAQIVLSKVEVIGAVSSASVAPSAKMPRGVHDAA